MVAERRLLKYLGVAFIAVFATSLAYGVLSGPILTGNASEVLVNAASDATTLRASILLQLATSVGVVALAALLFAALKAYNRALALIALGWWIAEAVALIANVLAIQALVPLGEEYVAAGAPESSHFESLGTALMGAADNAVNVHMLFFCFGAMIWYWLMFRSRVVPRWLSSWGLVAVPLMFAATVILLWDRDLDPGILLYAPYIPFELVMGVWLLVTGGSKKALPA